MIEPQIPTLVRADCIPNCLTDFDFDCPEGHAFENFVSLLGDLHTVMPCGYCTCEDIFTDCHNADACHVAKYYTNGASALHEDTPAGVVFCYCSNADDFKSIPRTGPCIDDSGIVVAARVKWHFPNQFLEPSETCAPLIPIEGQKLSDEALRMFPDNEGKTRWLLWKSVEGSNLRCPTSGSHDGWELVGTYDDLEENEVEITLPFDNGDLETCPEDVCGPQDPPIYICNRTVPLPAAFALEVFALDSDDRAHRMAFCPIAFVPFGDAPQCPPCEPGPCCHTIIDPEETFADDCVDNLTNIHTRIDIYCDEGCTCSGGTGTVELFKDLSPIASQPTIDGDNVYIFENIECVPGEEESYTISVTWSCNDEGSPCPAGDNCRGEPATCLMPISATYDFSGPIE